MSAEPPPCRPSRRFRRTRGAASAGLSFGLMAVLVMLAAGVAALALGRVNLDAFKPLVVSALQDRLGANYVLSIGELGIERQEHGLALAVDGLAISRSDGRRVVSAPKADLIFDPLSLLAGRIKPSRVDIDGLAVTLRVSPDGSLDLTAGGETTAPEPAPEPGRQPAPEANAPSVAAPTSAPAPGARAKVMLQAANAINRIFDIAQGRDSPIAQLDHFGVENGRLTVDDREAGQKRGFTAFAFSLDRKIEDNRGVADVEMSAMGPSGRWSVAGVARGGRAEAHELAIQGDGFTIDEIALMAGKTSLPIDSDIPLSFKAAASFEGGGHVLDADARLALGQGFWRFDDPEFAPVFLDEFFAAAHWDAAGHRAMVDEAQIFSGDSHCFLTGVVTPPDHDAAPWGILLKQAEPCVIGPDRKGEKSVTVATVKADLSLDPPNKLLTVNRVEIVGPEVAAAAQGTIDWVNGPHIRMGLSAGNMTAAGALAVWPNAFGAPVRGWMGDHLLGGTLDSFRMAVDLDDLDLRIMRAQHAPMDDRISMDYAFHDAAFTFLDGAPPVKGVAAKGHSSGRSARIEAPTGYIEGREGRRIGLSDGVLATPDFEIKPIALIVSAHGQGGLETLAEVLSTPGFATVASLPLDPKTTRGQFSGDFTFRTRLPRVYDPSLARIEVNATVANFAADHLIGKAGLDQGALAVTLADGIVHVVGTGKIFGAPATLEFTRDHNQPPRGVISFPMDEAARAKAGLNFGAAVVGPVAVRIAGDVGAEHPKAQVDLDFVKAGLNNPVPGLFKPAGRPAKATFSYAEDARGAAILDNFTYDGSGQTAKGVLQLAPDGALAGARLSAVKFSPGDDLRLDVQKTGDVMKIVARGESLDARPFLRDLTGGDPRSSRSSDFDLDLKATLLTGANRQIVSNAELHLARKKSGQFQALNLSGKIGGDAVKGVLSHPDDGAPLFTLTAADGGALLAFFDFYSHMEGGALRAQLRLAESSFAGTVDIDNFVLRGEPAMKSFANSADAGKIVNKVKLDPNSVAFARMHAELKKANDRLSISDGVIANAEIGSTIEGWIDFDRDTLDLSGTFVPAYGVNNLFGKLPVLGLVLGGGQQEGLIGVNFRVSGSASAPTLSINPLSAIAPGFLRKIFGVLPH